MPDSKRNRTLQYLGEFGGAMGAYFGILFLSISLRDEVTSPALRVFLSVSPVFPTLLVLWVILRKYGRFDELQQRVQSEALAFSAIVTALGSFTYGFLEHAGFPPLNIMWVMPVMIGLQGISVPFIARKFR